MTKENLKPVNEKVLVKVAQEPETTVGGIIISSVKQERKYEGVVIDVGTHPDIAVYGVKTGDYVYYPKGLNTEIIVDNETYDFVSIYDILAVGQEE